jgi:hypothetical protein
VLNALPAPILLDIAIFFTALAWGLGFYLVDRRVYIFAPLAIGCLVCLLGYSVASLGAPVWLVVAALAGAAKNAESLRRNLGDLFCVSHPT